MDIRVFVQNPGEALIENMKKACKGTVKSYIHR